MSAAKIDKLVRMANQIGDFFAPMPEEEAAKGVATHLQALLDAEDDRRDCCKRSTAAARISNRDRRARALAALRARNWRRVALATEVTRQSQKRFGERTMTMRLSRPRTPRGGWLDKSATVAKPGFNRWLVPPAALAIHLCIGMSYGLSVFWLPLSKAIGGDHARLVQGHGRRRRAVHDDLQLAGQRSARRPSRSASSCSALSAALFGGWLERAGPRKAGLVAAFCWGGGFLVSALGVYIHQLWMIWLGLGVLGGIGLGLGYISPVSTLVKWFPDRRGMATGMAIMGFGGGAMIGSPLANLLMNHFKTADRRRRLADDGDDGRRSISSSCAPARSAIASRPTAGGRRAGRRRPTGARA